MTFYPTYALEKLDISLTTVGLLMAAFPIGGVVGSMSAGALSELIGRRKPFIWVPGLILPAAYLGLLMVDSFLPAYLLLFLSGLCAMAVPPILATIPLDMRLPPREVAVALGLVRTLFPIGATIGPLLVGFLTGGHRLAVSGAERGFADGVHPAHRRQVPSGDGRPPRRLRAVGARSIFRRPVEK